MDIVQVDPSATVDFASERVVISSAHGDLNVLVSCVDERQWTTGRVIITCGDFALSPQLCFGTLFNFQHLKPLINSFNLVHVDWFTSMLVCDDQSQWPTMEMMEDILHSVVDHFKIVTFLGFGIGFGADLLAQYACNHPHNVAALMLSGPTFFQLSYSDWFSYHKHLLWLWWWGLTENTISLLHNRLFEFAQDKHQDLVSLCRRSISQCNPDILRRYLWAYCAKSDHSESIGKSKTKTLLIYSEESAHADTYVDAWLGSHQRPTTVTQLGLRESAGTLATEQHVALCAETIYLWLQGLGFRVEDELQSFDQYLKKH